MTEPLPARAFPFEVVPDREHPDTAEATAPAPPSDSIIVVGIGADGFDGLGHAAQTALRGADVIVGSWRQLNLLPDSVTADRRPWPSPLLPAIEPLFRDLTGLNVAVLASGDPMFHGIGSTLSRVLGADRIHVIPAASSVSLACARLGWPLDKTPVASLVTQPVETLIPLVDAGTRFLVLGRDERSGPDIAQLLMECGHDAARLTILSDLGSSDEHVLAGTAAAPPTPVSALAVIAVEPASLPGRSIAPGLDDSEYDHDGQLTKSDVRAISLSALAPRPGEMLWDIGGGSGSIAIEWLRLAPGSSAVTFESRPERSERIRRNANSLGVPRLKVLGAAPAALSTARYAPGASAPDAIFIGGGLTVAGLPDTAWTMLRPGGRIVANAVTVESERVLWDLRERFGGTIRRIDVSTEHAVGTFTSLRPALPVTQWRALKPTRPEGVL